MLIKFFLFNRKAELLVCQCSPKIKIGSAVWRQTQTNPLLWRCLF